MEIFGLSGLEGPGEEKSRFFATSQPESTLKKVAGNENRGLVRLLTRAGAELPPSRIKAVVGLAGGVFVEGGKVVFLVDGRE